MILLEAIIGFCRENGQVPDSLILSLNQLSVE